MLQRIKQNLGVILIFFFSFIPLVLWFMVPDIEPRFGSIQNSLSSLGEICGLIGITMFSINIILTTRFIFLEKLFTSLNIVYKRHSKLGQITLILLILHPLFLLPRYAGSFEEARNFLFINNNLAHDMGVFSLWFMLILIILTLYLCPKYNLWKIAHKFFGVALYLGGMHAYFIPNYILKNFPLRLYIFTFVIFGIISFLYKSVFEKFLVKKNKYVVVEIKKLNNVISEISLKPINNKIEYVAGQYAFFTFYQKGISTESHPFSFSSSPKEELLKVTVKNLGEYTKKIVENLKIDSLVLVEGPFGNFSYKKIKNKNQIWIAGGVGITPFVSMAKDLLQSQNDYSVDLFYCIRNQEEAVYLNLLQEISNKLNNNFRITTHFSEKDGHINCPSISNNCSDFENSDILICASTVMTKGLVKSFLKNGKIKRQIHFEEFSF